MPHPTVQHQPLPRLLGFWERGKVELLLLLLVLLNMGRAVARRLGVGTEAMRKTRRASMVGRWVMMGSFMLG